MTVDKRRPRGIVGMIVSDPYRKLVALVLAVGLWFFISLQINKTIVRSISLTAVGPQRAVTDRGDRLAVVLPTNLVVLERFMDVEKPIDRVEVVLSGPRFRIDQFEDQALDLEITKFLQLDDWQTRKSIEFTASDIRRDITFKDIDIELRPSRIRLDVQKIDELMLRLKRELVDLQSAPFDGRLQPDTATFQPDTARILGPADSIEQFKSRAGAVLRATLKELRDERQVSMPLELIDANALGLRLAEPVVMTMQVLPQTRVFELELPIVVDDLALPPELRGQFRPGTNSRLVRIRAGGELRTKLVTLSEQSDKVGMREWAFANLRLFVHVPKEAGASSSTEIDRQARLLLVGPLHTSVERGECLLEETVLVKLRRNP